MHQSREGMVDRPKGSWSYCTYKEKTESDQEGCVLENLKASLPPVRFPLLTVPQLFPTALPDHVFKYIITWIPFHIQATTLLSIPPWLMINSWHSSQLQKSSMSLTVTKLFKSPQSLPRLKEISYVGALGLLKNKNKKQKTVSYFQYITAQCEYSYSKRVKWGR